MKKYIPLFIIISLLLSACNSEKDLFEKKKYCFELKIEWISNELIAEKFYSPIRNSCIYKYADGSKYQKIVDALTGEIIDTNQLDIERNEIIDKKIKQLKWE